MDKFEVKRKINMFKSNLISKNIRQASEAYKSLYYLGNLVVDDIVNELEILDVEEIDKGEEFRCITGLFSLLYDLNVDKAKEVSEKIFKNKKNNVLKSIIHSICSFNLNNFYHFKYENINIYIRKNFLLKKMMKKILMKWLSYIDEDDLKGIERIYILKNAREYLGCYRPVFNVIELVWKNSIINWSFFSRFYKYTNENVFYHEIGHHALRHNYGFLNLEEEKNADEFSRKILQKKIRLKKGSLY